MSSQPQDPAARSLDSFGRNEDPAKRIERLNLLLEDLQAHTDALYELAQKATPRGSKAAVAGKTPGRRQSVRSSR